MNFPISFLFLGDDCRRKEVETYEQIGKGLSIEAYKGNKG